MHCCWRHCPVEHWTSSEQKPAKATEEFLTQADLRQVYPVLQLESFVQLLGNFDNGIDISILD
jgi:hypothetical protein